MKPIKEGKVREIYDNGDSLIMVATDRISCFDVILNNTVTKKGTVLTQMSKFWFDLTQDILPNHMISVDVKDMPEYFQQPQFDGNSMMCRKLNMLPIECIVRGYITGSGWASYQENGTVCGIKPRPVRHGRPVLPSAHRFSVHPHRGISRLHLPGYDGRNAQGSGALEVSGPDLRRHLQRLFRQ